MKRLLLIGFLVVAVVLVVALWLTNQPSGVSQADAQTMRVAGELYANGQPAQAAQMLEQLARRGVVNADLYYNLGTAYLQSGDMGRAVANLRRAQALSPRDPAIAANLAAAQSRIGVPPALPPDSWAENVARAVEARLTTDETALVALALWLLFFVLWLLMRQVSAGGLRGVLRFAFAVSFVLAVVSVAVFGMRLYHTQSRPVAVSLADATQVYDAAGRNMAGVTLAGGEVVEVVDGREGWLFVRLGTGIYGWVRTGAVEVV